MTKEEWRRRGICIDCGVKIDYRSKRCRKCMGKNSKGSKSPRFNPNKPKKFCIDCGKEICVNAKARCFDCNKKWFRGKNHFLWKHEKGKEERIIDRGYSEYNDWRTEVYKRDKYICQKCKQNSNNLVAHHIFPYSQFKEIRLNIDNGITLCRNCHNDFHKKFGKKGNNTTQLNEFLEEEF